MTKGQKGLLILLTPFVVGFLLGFLVGGGCSSDKTADGADRTQQLEAAGPEEEQPATEPEEGPDDDVDGLGAVPERREVIYYRNRLAYSSLFADLNEAHLAAARSKGLKTVPKTRAEVEQDGLVKIEDNEWLVVDELRYSVPYLTEAAAEELNRIARAFRDSLRSKELLDYKLIVSSVLRTEEDVARLRRSGNPNASNNSAHCYGTTFDITYTRYSAIDDSEAFMQPFELTKVLGEVLLDEKKAGRVLVKYERKEHCFHITAIN